MNLEGRLVQQKKKRKDKRKRRRKSLKPSLNLFKNRVGSVMPLSLFVAFRFRDKKRKKPQSERLRVFTVILSEMIK